MKIFIVVNLLFLFYQNSSAAKTHPFEVLIGMSREGLVAYIDEFKDEFKIIENSDTLMVLIHKDNNNEQIRFEIHIENEMINQYSLFVTCYICFIEYRELLHVTDKWIKYPESIYYNKKEKVLLKIEDVANDISWCKKITYSSQKSTRIKKSKGKKKDLTVYSLLDTNIAVISQAILLDTNVTKRDSIISERKFLELSNSKCLSIDSYYFVYDRETKNLIRSDIYDYRGICKSWSLYNRETGEIYYKVEYNIENSVIKVHKRSNTLILDKKADFIETHYNEGGEIARIKKSKR